MIQKLSQKIEYLWLDKYIVYKTFKRNTQTIKCKTFYFSNNDFCRKWIIEDNKPIKEISILYENGIPIEGSKQIFNFVV